MSGLYIHIPFCKRKCPYCAFYSQPVDDEMMRRFIRAAVHEIESLKPSPDASGIETIYIGGGTPTVLDAADMGLLLDALRPITERASEITCESNPESMNHEKLFVLADCGVNRLSIGVQSFSDANLLALGRLHDAESARDAFARARAACLANISIDLMYGLPGQTVDSWADDLAGAVELGPEHISFYGLTIEDGTEFARRYGEEGRHKLPAEEECREMYYAGIDMLNKAGYRHYEISSFARPGYESKHNLNYWRHGKYAAVGPSAAGFDGARRWKNVSDTQAYTDAVTSGVSPVAEDESLSEEQLISESMMLGLRLVDGMDLSKLSRQYELDVGELYGDTIRSLVDLGKLELHGDVVRLSRDGLFVSDALIAEFILI